MKQIEFIKTLLTYINFDGEVDDIDKIHDTIEKDLIFKGTNLWILVFAIIVASVGLNMNSTAVIIGAMLISPLMGPINGIGYSIATYNFPLFRKAVKNYGFAVGSSLVASTVYFAISPISTAHSELLARTSPTIYDVLIAFFGGLAGIVAISSKQKGNVIPGVAIATALMPPLCTAGYGLATAQFTYFFGAMYLFTINTVFIGIAAMIVSQILEFPIRTLVDSGQKKQVNRLISFVIALVIVPSIYFGYNLVQKERFNEAAHNFVKNVSIFEGNYLLKYEINPNDRSILLIYGGSSLNDTQKALILSKSEDFNLRNANIEFRQGLSFDDFTKKDSELDNLKAEMSRLNLLLHESDKIIDSLNTRGALGRIILEEIKEFFPEIIHCTYAETKVYDEQFEEPEDIVVVVFTIAGKTIDDTEKQKVSRWLRARLKKEEVRVFYEYTAEGKDS